MGEGAPAARPTYTHVPAAHIEWEAELCCPCAVGDRPCTFLPPTPHFAMKGVPSPPAT